MLTKYPLTPSADKRIEAVPSLAAFIEHLEASVQDDPDALWECRLEFESLVRSTFFTDVVNYELACMTADRDRAIEKTRAGVMPLVMTSRYSLIARLQAPLTGPDTRSLYGLSEHQLLGVIGPDSVELDCYEQTNPHPHEVLDRTKQLTPRGVRVMKAGEVVRMRSPEDVYQVRATGERTVILLLSSSTKTRVRWRYDPKSLLPTDAISTDPVAARVEYGIWMMAELGAKSCVPTLVMLASHHDHYVRWAAVRAVMRLDSDAGGKLLRTAADDAHPHVRNAARRALEKLQRAGIPVGADAR